MNRKKRSRSRVAEQVIRYAEKGMSIACIAAATGRRVNAVRQILSRAGISVQELRAARRARPKEIQPHSPAAELLLQANDAAVAKIRAAAEEQRPVPAAYEPALRAQGFPVGRRQHRRAAAAVLRELRAAQYQNLLRLLPGSSAATIAADVIDREFARVGDAFRPRRKTSWQIFRTTIKERFEAIAGGRIAVEPTGAAEGGLPVYRMTILEDLTAVVRQTPEGLRVARAEQTSQPGTATFRGMLLRLEGPTTEGLTAVILTSRGEETTSYTCLVVRDRHEQTWNVDDLEIIRQGDTVAVISGGCLRIDDTAEGLEIVQLSDSDLVHLAAWCMVGEPCWIETETPFGPQRWRCELPSAQTTAVLDVASLDWCEAPDDGNVVKVRPCREKYRVTAGAGRVAEAAARGCTQIPVVIEVPQ